MPKLLLTDAFLRKIPAQLKLTEYWDARVAGLCLRQSPRNHLTWCFRYRPKGESAFKRLALGSYPEVSLALARTRAQTTRVEVSSGQDPAKDLSEEKARNKLFGLTFEALAEDYLERYAKVHKTSWRQDELLLKVHVYPIWGTRPAHSLTRKDAAELLDAIAAAAPASANRTQSILSKLFNWSVDSGLLTSNPIAFMKKRAAERPRERVLSNEEIQILWHEFTNRRLSGSISCALKLLLLTGQRPAEIAGIRVEEIKDLEDPASARIEIPSIRMKSKRAHIVPLTSFAREIVVAQKKNIKEEEEFILPSENNDEGPIARHSLSQALKRLINSLNEEHYAARAVRSLRADPPTPHDFRRTVATKMSSLGINRENRLAVLGHASTDTHGKHYDKYDRLKEKQLALEEWGLHLKYIVSK